MKDLVEHGKNQKLVKTISIVSYFHILIID